ncbi:2-amino-4-hydroxy-6-hydroxymethyldihydropteridine diphosphokinase, partial [bacterium]
MVKAYIGLGSNLGQPMENLHRALELLNESGQVKITEVSSVYLTEPVGYEDQDWFHNAVAEIETLLSPARLLKLLQETETQLGRERIIRWRPRTVDLDILCYGDEKISTQTLQV